MKKKLPIIITCVLVVGIAAFFVYQHFASKTVFNDGYVNGNTAGNLYNSGLYCEYNGTIYFANPGDSNRLYSMDANGTNVKKLSNDVVSYLNADDNYIYYVRNNLTATESIFNFNANALCRYSKRNGDVLVLDDQPSMYASLVGNYIYYIHYDTDSASTLYRVKIDGSEQKQISKTPYFTCSTNGQYIYYNGIEGDHNIYEYNTATGSQTQLYAGNCWMPVRVDNEVYFMDCEDDYKLAKVNLSTGDKTTLTEDRVDCFNIYGSYIYYQDNTTSYLNRVRTDGTDNEELFSGIYTKLNATSYYLYFTDFTTERTYRTSLQNPSTLEYFGPKYEDD